MKTKHRGLFLLEWKIESNPGFMNLDNLLACLITETHVKQDQVEVVDHSLDDALGVLVSEAGGTPDEGIDELIMLLELRRPSRKKSDEA